MCKNNNTIKLGENTYSFVWGDEFDSSSLDSSKWTWDKANSCMSPSDSNELILVDDERAIKLKDSKLVLTSSILSNNGDGSHLYGTPASVSTIDKMAYVYGYCEIRAKVPFGKGLWPSFWAVSDKTLHPIPQKKYITEIDVFEVFGTRDGIVPNLHKWYQKEIYSYDELHDRKCFNHTQFAQQMFCGSKNIIYNFGEQSHDISNLSNEFHTYGFEWTPEEISMYIDGIKYMTYDILNSYDDCDDMTGFHEPIVIIFNNFLFVNSSDYIPEFERGIPTVINDCEENLPAVYEIEYFRLYQNKEVPESKLYLKR
jgi:beta-glucanase (GH16 family)